MTKRYLDAQGKVEPFDPLDLVNAFLQREVSYDNLSKLQLVVNGHLNTPICEGQSRLSKGHKTDGCLSH